MRANFNKILQGDQMCRLSLTGEPPIRLLGDQIYQVRIIYEAIYRTTFPSHPYPDFCALIKSIC